MANDATDQGPIFIGGTGRSGTSVMGDLLNSHPDIVLPAHENKLIVERGGLRDLVGQLGGRFDIKRNHYAVMDFVRWGKKLRTLGFRDPALQARVFELRRTQGIGFHKACERVARENPSADLSLHAIGQGFGLAHYDSTANAFVQRICSGSSGQGIVDTEGLIAPFISTRVMGRAAALQEARTFLDALYAAPLRAASASRWCDDTPSNWLYADFLFELYPTMKFIHMLRDPRDVVGSYLKQVWAPSDPRVIVETFKAQFGDYEAVKSQLPPDRVMEIRIEDISAEKARVLEALSAFLGVENRFDGTLFFNERVHAGAYNNDLGDDVSILIQTELAAWMEKHGYLP